jgi:hypothetical protein
MTMDNYKTIEHKLRNLEPFKGNSLRGEVDSYGALRVWSYDTHIGTAWPKDDKILVTVFDEYRYSATTNRHQKLIRRAWAI